MDDLDADDDIEVYQVATFQMRCPVCPADIDIGVYMELRDLDGADYQEMILHPDLTELHVHGWQHQDLDGGVKGRN